MRIIRTALFMTLTIVSLTLSAQNNYSFKTLTYLESDSLSLELDYFQPDSCIEDAPLVIYLHGGGFSGGERTNGHEFCHFLANNGIPAATITYTLYMRGKNFGCDGILSKKVKAIQMAAYHSMIATQYFIQNAEEIGIDTNKIFLAGASAGAEAVLQAAYWDTTAVNFFPNVLSPCFKYAGVISGAGALLDINMINERTKIPAICFHGTCDPLVPYHIAPLHYCSQISSGYMMMFGGLAIYERLTDLNETVQLMSYCGVGHKHAGTPFFGREKNTVLEFIQQTSRGERFNVHRVFQNGEECNLGQDFVFCY
jgi:poly(3-hydroxybutyrate) depolymerase